MRFNRTRRSFAALTLASALTAVAANGQTPPLEIRGDVLTDAGPVPAPATCGCVTAPFTVMRLRPGWGYGHGPAAPETDAPPSRGERRRQQASDAETLRNLPTNYDDAISGNPHASVSIGLELTNGTALKRDDVEAAKWFLLAAGQGHEIAYVQLGHRYHRGLGLEQNDSAAAYWFYQAALRNDSIAMTALGGLYAAGRGVAQDWGAAARWWQRAKAWRFVGDTYACGLGVEQDNERALRAYEQGAESHDMSSAIQFGHMHAGGCAEKADTELALKAYQKAADQGYPEAQIALSQLLLQGRGVESDAIRAYYWARMAELRLPSGSLQSQAKARAAAAAKQMPAFLVTDTDAMVKDMIRMSGEPMNK